MRVTLKEIVLKDRRLKKGDECIYYGTFVNATGSTWGSCVVSEIIDPDLKIYRLTERDDKPREWIVQDIDEKIMIEKIGKDWGWLSWIKTQDESQ